MAPQRYQLLTLIALAMLLVMVWLLPPALLFEGLASYLPLHTTMETFSVVVAALIFGIGWNTYSRNQAGNVVLLACVFLAVGLLDFGHFLSYKGMPDFVTPASAHKAIWFWLPARMAVAVALLIIVLVPWRPLLNKRRRYWLLAGALGYAALFYALILFFPQQLPVVIVEGVGLTGLKVAVEYVIMLLHVITAVVLYRRIDVPQPFHAPSLFAAVVVLALSELCFTLYANLADLFNVVGHVYKVIAYAFLYRAVFISSIREPYERLHESQRFLRQSEGRYRDIVETAQEGVLQLDAEMRICFANQRMADLLGYSINDLHGQPIHSLIPESEFTCALDDREGLKEGRLDVRFANKQGQAVWVQLSITLASREGGMEQGALVMVTDITGRKLAEFEIQRRNQLLAAISRAQGRLILELERHDVFDHLLSELLRLTLSEYGFVGGVHHDAAGRPYFKMYATTNVAWDAHTQAFFEQHSSDTLEFHDLNNLIGAVITGGQVVIANDPAQDPRSAGVPPGHPTLNAFLGLPCERGERMLGVVGLANREGGYDSVLAEFLQPVRTTIAQMIEALHLEEARQQAQAELFTEKERAQITLASIGDAVITTDLAGRIDNLNPVAQQLTGWLLAEAVGQPLERVFRIIHEHTREPLENPAQRAVEENRVVGLANHALLVARDGREHAIEDSAAPIRDRNGNTMGCVLVFHDVSEKRQLQNRLIWQAGHDSLTGLPNRALLADRMQQSIHQAQRQQRMLVVVFLDLDGFKQINDVHGHDVGDHLLVEVAARLLRAMRSADTVARLGGDEFVMLMNGLDDAGEIDPALNRLLESVAAPYLVDGRELSLSASIGVTVYPMDATDSDTLLRHADQAMYLAKQGGRNRYHLFDAAQDREVQERRIRIERLQQAFQQQEFVLYYQPKVNLCTGEVVGAEALIRWQHPEHGLLLPGEFLPVMEHIDLINMLGDWVLAEALRRMTQWKQQGIDLPVSVNVAARQLQDVNFVVSLQAHLTRFPDVPPHWLELEILESAALGDLEHIRDVIGQCHALGVRIALDDFGTGFSSLAYLKRLPTDTVKIDRGFVQDILEDPDDRALVEGIVRLTQVFRREVIAEGVESVEQGILLIQLGVEIAQGFCIARAMPGEDLPAWMAGYRPDPRWRATPPASLDWSV